MYKLILGFVFSSSSSSSLWEDIKSHKNRSTNYLLDIFILKESYLKKQSNLHFFDSMNPPVKREGERERENKWKWNPISSNSSNYQLRQLIYVYTGRDWLLQEEKKRKRKKKKQNNNYISIFRSLLHCMCFILNRYIFLFSRVKIFHQSW